MMEGVDGGGGVGGRGGGGVKVKTGKEECVLCGISFLQQ